MPRQQVICVLGMHRSGTSLIARLINILGVDLGPESETARFAPDNPRGFWEHRAFVAINEAVLATIGHRWDDLHSFPANWQEDPVLDDLKAKARDAIQTFGGAELWGWKDPRTCLTLPFWQPLLPPMRYVMCLRSPSAVAGSLTRRNGFTLEKSAHLWLQYVAAALQHTAGHPRLFVFYDDVMADWANQSDRIRRFVGRDVGREDESVRDSLRATIEDELCHHRTSIVEVAGDSKLPFPAKALYLLLRAIVPRPGDRDERGEDTLLSEAVTAAAACAARPDEDRGRLAQALLESQLTERVADVAQLSAVLSERDAAIEWLQGELTHSQGRAAERERVENNLSAHERTIAMLQAREAQLENELATERQLVREREDGIAWLQAELTERERLRQRTEATSRSLSAQLEEIFNSRSWRWLTRYRRLHKRTRRWILRRARETRPVVQPEAPWEASRSDSPARGHVGLPLPSLIASGRLPVAAPDPYSSITLLPVPEPAEAVALVGSRGTGDRRRRIDVICFSIIDWEFRYQRPQQLMSQFAAHGHRVFYVSTSRFRSSNTPPGFAVRQIKENLYEVQLAAPGAIDVYGDVLRGDNGQALLDSLADLRSEYDISSAVAYVMIASWSRVAASSSRLWNWPLVYDCMDEWESFPGITPAMVKAEASLVRDCDLLIVTAARLYEKWSRSGRPVVLARNAVDYEFYATRCRPNAVLTGTRHPIVGYCGAIAEWCDLDLLAHLARERPQYSFVLVGGVFDVDVRPLHELPNVSLLGQQPYETMPQYMYHFDVCLIPFKINKTTKATDPVKLYEYLSVGKPVVSVDLPELESCREFVYLATNRDDFLVELDRAVVEQDRELVNRRRDFAAKHTWQDRYSRIREALANVMKRASVVIVTYNNLALTKLCLESVLRNTDYPNFEVIVVDNASSDGTPAYLRYLEARHPEMRVILNSQNHGFSRANNQGIAASRGDYLVLLNNDTMVPPGWLARLLNHLQDPTIGLVGPVTNFAGNEARVEVSYKTCGEMEHFAAERARQCDGQVADIHMLAMFCVAMTRETYGQVGPLDEQFGIGMFEDDDYAHRIRAHGRRVVCAADVFVHHVGQAAFKSLIEAGKYDELFAKNRRSFEDKWRMPWTRHQHAQLAFARGDARPSSEGAAE